MPSLDVQHLTDFDKMRYYCANTQTFAAHYTTRGNWLKLFTALMRVIFRLIDISLTFSERDVGIALSHSDKNRFEASISRKTNFKSSIWKWQRKILEVARFSLRDVTMAKIIRTNKLPSSPPPLVVINWQLSKQGIRWPVSLKRIAGSSVDHRSQVFFWSYPLTTY